MENIRESFQNRINYRHVYYVLQNLNLRYDTKRLLGTTKIVSLENPLSPGNKSLIYKAVIRPILTYGTYGLSYWIPKEDVSR